MTSLVSRTWTRRVDFIGPRLQTRGSPPLGSAAQIQGLISIASRGGGYWGGRPPLSLPRRASRFSLPLSSGCLGGYTGGTLFLQFDWFSFVQTQKLGILYGVQSGPNVRECEAMRRFWGESGKSRYAGRQKSTHAEGAYRPEPLRSFR